MINIIYMFYNTYIAYYWSLQDIEFLTRDVWKNNIAFNIPYYSLTIYGRYRHRVYLRRNSYYDSTLHLARDKKVYLARGMSRNYNLSILSPFPGQWGSHLHEYHVQEATKYCNMCITYFISWNSGVNVGVRIDIQVPRIWSYPARSSLD